VNILTLLSDIFW